MTWIVAGVLASLLLALSSNIDQLVMRRFFKGQAYEYRVFLSFSRIAFIPLLFFIPAAFDHSVFTICILMALGVIGFYVILPYTKAVEFEESNKLAPFFQTIPIFMFLFLYIGLGETITLFQAIGCFIIIASSFCIMADHKTLRVNRKALLLMLLTAVGLAFSQSLQRYFLVSDVTWIDLFLWTSVGKLIYACFIYLFSSSSRMFFYKIIKLENRKSLFAIVAHQISTNGAYVFFVISLSLAPAGVLTQSINGFQPIFVLSIGLLFAKLFPSYFNPPKTKHEFAWYAVFMALMLVGVFMIYGVNL